MLTSIAALALLIPLPGDDPPPCLSNLQVHKSLTSTATLAFYPEAPTLSWSVTPACPTTKIWLNGQQVAATGSKVVQQSRTTTYRLYAVDGAAVVELGKSTIVQAQVSAWVQSAGYWLRVANAGAAAAGVREQARAVLGRLPESARVNFVGQLFEIQIVPMDRLLTELPDWDHLEGECTWDSVDEDGECLPGGRTYDESRGGGAVPLTPDRWAMYIGAETQLGPDVKTLGYTLYHELGHSVMDAFIQDDDAIEAAFAAHDAAGRACINDQPGYTCARASEWFAEAVPALFGSPIIPQVNWPPRDNYDCGGWMKQFNPELFKLAAPYFSGRPSLAACPV